MTSPSQPSPRPLFQSLHGEIRTGVSCSRDIDRPATQNLINKLVDFWTHEFMLETSILAHHVLGCNDPSRTPRWRVDPRQTFPKSPELSSDQQERLALLLDMVHRFDLLHTDTRLPSYSAPVLEALLYQQIIDSHLEEELRRYLDILIEEKAKLVTT